MPSWSNKDVLIVSPAPIFPRDYGNRLRIFRICERLKAQGARLHFLHYASEADWRQRLPMAALAEMQAYFTTFHIAPPTRPLHAGAEGAHHLADEWWDPSIGQMIDWLASVQRIDAAVVNYTWLSRALLHLPDSCLKILDTHDRFSGRKELFVAHGLEPEFFYMTPEEEALALGRADVVWSIKEEEAAFFRLLTDKPVYNMPHIDPVTPLAGPGGEFLRVGLIGADNSLNRENFEAFLDAATADVGEHLTQVELVVAGSVCKSLRARAEKFITFMGYVERIEDFYQSVDCVAVPMRFSTGQKIKTAEALSFGKPVVALAHSFEGFHPTDPFHRLGGFDEMMAAIATLVRRPQALPILAAASRQSAAASEAEVCAALTATIGHLSRLRHPTFWFALSAAECAAHPLVLDHVAEAADFLRNLFPVGFVFLGETMPGDDMVRALGHLGLLAWVMDDQRRDLGALHARIAPVSLAEVQANALGAWVTTRAGLALLAGLAPGAGFLQLDMFSLSMSEDPVGTDADLAQALAGAGAGHVLCAQDLAGDLAAALSAAGWQFVLLPHLAKSVHAPLLNRLRAQPARAETDQSLALDLPAKAAARRAGLNQVAASARLVNRLLRQGRAAGYRLQGPWPSRFALEYLLRAGSALDLSQAVPPGPLVTYAKLEAALRNDSGWAQVWALGLALRDRLRTQEVDAPAEVAGAEAPEAAALAPEAEPADAAAEAEAAVGRTPVAPDGTPAEAPAVVPGEVPADAPGEARADAPADAPLAPAAASLVSSPHEARPTGAVGPAARAPRRAPPARLSDANPGLGYTRLTGVETFSGQDAIFGQLRIYRPENVGMDAMDLQFINPTLVGRSFARLVLRFAFDGPGVTVFLRRNDCSPEAFADPRSDWMQDDWGPYLLYPLGEALRPSHTGGLQGADLALLQETLALVPRLAWAIGPSLSGELFDRFGRTVAAITGCDLAPPDGVEEQAQAV